jgi:hypothetical protein
LCRGREIPPIGGLERRSIAAGRPPIYPQAGAKERRGKREFPPCLSTAVEGSGGGGFSLQKRVICSVLAGWYARRSAFTR